MIKLVIFDFDGVIINEYAKHYELSQKQITGLTKEEFKKLFEGNINVEREKLKSRNTGFDFKTHFSNYKATVIIDSEIQESLKKLFQKYVLGIISSANEYGTNSSLKNSGLEGIFSFNYGYETNPIKVEKFKQVLDEYKVEPNQCVFITDTVGDILEAKEVGIKSIAVDYGYHERERLEKVTPIKIISSFSEIEKVVEQL